MNISSDKLVNRKIAREYKKLLKVSYQTLSDDDKNLIRKALDLAIDAHKDQFRKSGEPYIFHPISVAKIVAEKIGLDANSIAAALLHDVVELCPMGLCNEINLGCNDSPTKLMLTLQFNSAQLFIIRPC